MNELWNELNYHEDHRSGTAIAILANILGNKIQDMTQEKP